MTMSDLGMSFRLRTSMFVRMRSSGFRPGSRRATEPVERITFLALMLDLPLFPSRSTVWIPPCAGPVSLPYPSMTGAAEVGIFLDQGR